jgi:hypothetical protein
MTHRFLLLLFGLALAASCAFGQTARHPRDGAPRIAPPPLSPAQQNALLGTAALPLPWFDDVESGPGLWTPTGMWHRVLLPQQYKVIPAIFPRLVTYPDAGYLPSPYSGSFDWWFGEDSTGTFIGGGFDRSQAALSGGMSRKPVSGYLLTPPVSLVGQTKAVLNFKTWWEVEGVDANEFDLMHVEVSTNQGNSWLPLGRGTINPLNDANGESWKSFSSGGLGQQGYWIDQYFDLKPYVGNVVLVSFRFETIDTLFNGFRGWFIDDIKISADTIPAPSISTVTPAVVDTGSVVTITGGNFANGAIVQLDTAYALRYAVISSSVATFHAPPFGGIRGVRITNPDGKTAFAARAVAVVTTAPPKILTIAPDSAAVGVSVSVTITGTNFNTGTTADIGGFAAPLTANAPTQITVTSPATLPEGSYNVRVSNPGGLSDVSILGFRVYTPTIVVNPVGDPSVGKTVGLNILPPGGRSFVSGMLYYRQGGKLAYDSLALTAVAGGYHGYFPPAVMTIRGVEYWVALNGGNGNMTYPLSFPAQNPAIFPVLVPQVTAPVALSPTTYRMVSAPLVFQSPYLQAQLTDDFGSYAPTVWRSYRWNKSGYVESSPSTTMRPGYAHWVIAAAGGPFSFSSGSSVQTGTPYYMEIDTGWTMIATPFGFPVNWGSFYGGFNLIGPYAYDGAQYRIDTVLVPFDGYFVRNNYQYPLVVSVDPVDASLYVPVIGKVSASKRALGPEDFALRLGVDMPGTKYRDTYNYVGLRSDALAGQDRYDAPKPPPIGDGLRVSILEGGTDYLENFKPAGTEGQSWIVSVRASGIKGDAVMSLTPAGNLPAGYEIHVINLTDENAAPVSTGSFVLSLPSPGTEKYFKVMIGTAAFAAKESKGVPLQPVAFALEQNYPNPFNPETMIRYTLAKKTAVTLVIFNGLGQRVRTLVNGEESTGTHDVRWNGTNDAGSGVASGVYFCRLVTDGFTAVRKLVLIR